VSAPSNIRSMRDAETFNESASHTVSHYARGFGMLSGMIETMRLADRLGRHDEVRIALDKALAFIAEHDGKAPVPHTPSVPLIRGGWR